MVLEAFSNARNEKDYCRAELFPMLRACQTSIPQPSSINSPDPRISLLHLQRFAKNYYLVQLWWPLSVGEVSFSFSSLQTSLFTRPSPSSREQGAGNLMGVFLKLFPREQGCSRSYKNEPLHRTFTRTFNSIVPQPSIVPHQPLVYSPHPPCSASVVVTFSYIYIIYIYISQFTVPCETDLSHRHRS